jgi:tetratricopeptide (TPR) repeat protein
VAYSQAREAAVSALEIDDKLAEAHTSLAGVKAYYEWDFAGAERKYLRAIELNPRYSVAHHWYAHHLMAMGRFEEAVREINLAYELDPLSLSINVSVGLAFYWGHQFDRAAEKFNKTLELDSSFALAHVLLGQTYGQEGRHEMAIEELQKAKALDQTPQVNAILSHAYALSGRTEEAREFLAELEARSSQEYVPAYFIAAIYVALDKPDEAFKWLERAFDEHSAWLVWLKVDPKLNALHSDRRFAELLRRIGLAA